MFNKIPVILMLVCMLPITAHATWYLNTWVQTGGGNIVVQGGTPQTSANGSVLNSYTTSRSFSVTVNPDVGYKINKVNYNNVVTSNPTQTSYTVQGPGDQNVYATFFPQLLSVTASTGEGGSVNLSSLSGIYYGTTLSVVNKFIFTPSPSTSRVASISGVPAGATVSPALPAAANSPVTVTLPVGFTFTSNIALYGTFSGPPVAKTGPPQLVMNGTRTTLDGSSSNGTISSYSWSQTSGPGFPATRIIADNTSGIQTTFTPTVTGTYTFRLTVTGGSTASTTVTVTNNLVDALRDQCYNCHRGVGIGTARNVFGNWSSSQHRAKGVTCSQCHIGTNSGGHPGELTSGSVNESTFTFNAPFGTGNFCRNCHGEGVTHRTPGMICAVCHKNGEIHNPDAKFSEASTVCFTCHGEVNTPHFHSKARLEAFRCGQCHNQDGHNPLVDTAIVVPQHFNGYTSMANTKYSAAYVTPATECSNCHQGGDPTTAADLGIKQFRSEWAASGHGDVKASAWKNSTANNWKSSVDCQQCHTSKGFIRFVNMSTGIPIDGTSPKFSEPLTCDACHQPNFIRRSLNLVGPSFTYRFPVNSGTYVTSTYMVSSSYWTNSESNICIPCHSGTISGEIIKKATAFTDFTAAGRLRPHGMVAGGTIGKAIAVGYNFDETTYQNKHNTFHSFIGAANYWGDGNRGPCITCHMSGGQHTFAAVAVDAGGTITGVTAQAICDKCHGTFYVAGGPMTPNVLNARKAGFAAALLVLKAQLKKAGFDTDTSVPKNWGASAHVRANNMGAYYNYFLLRDGDRALYVHGPAYSRRLIVASLNWLDNAAFNNSAYATITRLASEGLINGATRDSAISYLNITSDPNSKTGVCAGCHDGSVNSN